MRKSDRLFQLVNLLLSRKTLSADEIADEMGISVRTVYRYLNDLSSSGIPVYHDQERGYRLSEGYALPALALTQDEYDALVAGVKLVQSWTGNELAGAASSLLHKIQATSRENIEDINFSNMDSPVLFSREDDSKNWDLLRKAIREQQSLNLDYIDSENRSTEREIYPINLSFWGNKWTVGAWCFKRHDYRDFRLDRINHLTTSETNSNPPDRVCLADYINTVMKKKPGH